MHAAMKELGFPQVELLPPVHAPGASERARERGGGTKREGGERWGGRECLSPSEVDIMTSRPVMDRRPKRCFFRWKSGNDA